MQPEAAFQRLRRISDFIFDSRSRDQVLAFLSSHVCPYGEVSGTGVADLSSDGVISVLARYGFSSSIPQPPDTRINEDHPAAEAFRTLELQIVSLKGIKKKYRDVNPEIDENGEYKVGIWVPISKSLLYGFALTSEKEALIKFSEYFLCIGSLLAHWENANSLESHHNSSVRIIDEKPMTIRQRKIIELIKEGRTNASIASILGYSESLIRQETIVIYKKLGVNGRHDLVDHPRENENKY